MGRKVGHETTAGKLNFMLSRLAQLSDVQVWDPCLPPTSPPNRTPHSHDTLYCDYYRPTYAMKSLLANATKGTATSRSSGGLVPVKEWLGSPSSTFLPASSISRILYYLPSHLTSHSLPNLSISCFCHYLPASLLLIGLSHIPQHTHLMLHVQTPHPPILPANTRSTMCRVRVPLASLLGKKTITAV